MITSGGYGVSAEYQGNLFGLYLKQYGTKNNAPYYRQASFHKKEMFLYRSSDKTWNIGSDIFRFSSERKYVYNSQMSITRAYTSCRGCLFLVAIDQEVT